MRIQYRANGMQRDVSDVVGKALISRHLATRVYQTRQIVAEDPEVTVEISTRTGKPKRQYKRRDMAVEE